MSPLRRQHQVGPAPTPSATAEPQGRSASGVRANSASPSPGANGQSGSPATPVLTARNLSVRFGGVAALTEVSLELYEGRCLGLVGENGAGKSTLGRVICGLLAPQEGEICVQGEQLTMGDPHSAKELGIAIVPQEPIVLPHLTVSENIAVGNRPRGAGGLIDWRKTRRQAAEALEMVGAQFSPDEAAGSLSVAEQHLVGLARALRTNPKVLILDEITASLSPVEAEHIFGIVDGLRASGTSVVMVSHRLAEMRRVADVALILRDGHVVDLRTIAYTPDRTIVELMLGRDVADNYPKVESQIGGTALEVRSFTREGYFHDVDLKVREGEIVGLAGLVGAGRSEFARSVVGVDPLDEGEATLFGSRYRPTSPRHAMKRGLAYVPEDRGRGGLIARISIRRNLSLAVLPSLSPWMFVQRSREHKLAEHYARNMEVKAGSLDDSVNTLSGGNQQKVLLGKWLATQPKVLILDEPTRGVDVGTKAEIHRQVSQLAHDGLAVMMISSDLEEVLAMSDRVITFFEGGVSGRFVRGDGYEPSQVLSAMSGLAVNE